eukprot:TRINITY_DN372_c0_g1_i3.p1 TRINITY_DN372_c0_g1~~TRINITY_DN372_c0_g1_i3.p1  ORF type:complete len:274 (-),score=78.88 TRINITY_DN372_c0_g1_i3:137-934(-)
MEQDAKKARAEEERRMREQQERERIEKQRAPARTGWGHPNSAVVGETLADIQAEERRIEEQRRRQEESLRRAEAAMQPQAQTGWGQAPVRQREDMFWDTAPAADETPAFGVAVPEDILNWAKPHLLRINGSTDATILEFLITVDSEKDTTMYLRQEFGSSELVTSFAEQWLDRKAKYLKKPRKGERTVQPKPHAAAPAASMADFPSLANNAPKTQQSQQPVAEAPRPSGGKRKGKKGKKGQRVDNLVGVTVHSNRIMQGEIDYPK